MTLREILRQRIDTFISLRYGAPANIVTNMLPPPEEPSPHKGILSHQICREGSHAMETTIIPSPRLTNEEMFKVQAKVAGHKERIQGNILLSPEGLLERKAVLSINRK